MNITDWYVMPQISRPIVFNRVVAPRFGLSVNDETVTKALPEARRCIGEIARLLGGNALMAGDAPSLADLLLAPQLSMLALAPEGAEILRLQANLKNWLDRMEARPSMQATGWDRLLEKTAAAA